MKPDSSIIIPTRRRPTELADAIRGVLAHAAVTTGILAIDDCPDGFAMSLGGPTERDDVRYRRALSPSRGRPALAAAMLSRLSIGYRIGRSLMRRPGATEDLINQSYEKMLARRD